MPNLLNLNISSRRFTAAALLTSGTLAWFFLLNFYGPMDIPAGVIPNEPLNYYGIGQLLFYGFAVFSAIIGSFISPRINRRDFLIPWILIGVISTMLLAFSYSMTSFMIIHSLLGISLGLGLPSSMAFIADSTLIEERGRVSGFIILFTFLIGFASMAIIRFLNLEVTSAIILFAAVRSISVFALLIDSFEVKNREATVTSVLPKVAYKEYFFYLFPWVMFSIIAGLAWNVLPLQYAAVIEFGTILRYVCIAVFGLVAGFAADKFGRKQPIIFALIMLGVSFAVLSFGFSDLSILIYLVCSGIAWGMLFTIFLVVPGDLSTERSREKFYALGYILPLAILFALTSVPGRTIATLTFLSTLTTIFSIVLLLSIVPILHAKETLPKEKIDEQNLKKYVEKVEETVQENK